MKFSPVPVSFGKDPMMKTDRSAYFYRYLFALFIVISVASTSLINAQTPTAASASNAIDRGYRTGYSDGYQAGFRDVNANSQRDYASNAGYQSADRGFNDSFGPLDDYRDGYQQGFAAGYS